MNRTQTTSLVACALFAGCLSFKPVVEQTRFFTLNPAAPNASTANPASQPGAVGVSPVEIPDYLESKQMVLRNGNNEIRYLADLCWAERLSKGVHRALIANLDSHLGATHVALSAWRRGDVRAVVSVTLQRFDTDESGRAILEARWRVTNPAGDLAHDGSTSLSKQGPQLTADPGGAVGVLGDLLGDLAGRIAADLRLAFPAPPRAE